jgi:hypothetical protein
MCSLTSQVRRVRIPAALMHVLIEAGKLMSEEPAIDVSPADEEVSAGGADLLKAPHPYLVKW